MATVEGEVTQPIENYGIIGDMRTAALVGMDGSIDFFCYPDFDSPSVFAALLDPDRGGRFTISLKNESGSQRQIYLPSTNILLTRLHTPDALVEICDFMPIDGDKAARVIIRKVTAVRGNARVLISCAPRFDYSRIRHRAERTGEHDIVFVPDSDAHPDLALRSSVTMEIDGEDAISEFHLEEDGSAVFVLFNPEESPDALDGDLEEFTQGRFDETARFWRQWASQTRYRGRWPELVERSSLVLKLLTSDPHGSMVAAATFGLPENIGGERNWDYRYTWIRDSAFALYALIRLGYGRESVAFMRWLEDLCSACTEDGTLQVLYGLDGRTEIGEEILDHFSGYGGSRPVRIGNGAYDQLQLDIYGELIDAIYLSNKHVEPISDATWRSVSRSAEWVAQNWQCADEGIWEVRSGRHEFLHSRLMCWVALDRALRIARQRSFPAPVEAWQSERDAIYESIHEEFWDAGIESFVQRKGSQDLDAAVLLMPLVKFISPTDPKWLSTLKAIGDDLVHDAQVYRYQSDDFDGLEGHEGTFTPCSFWYIENLSRSGEVDKARLLFEKMAGYANHLGLFAEELGPLGEHLGNFPQALSHLALISAAWQLDHDLHKQEN